MDEYLVTTHNMFGGERTREASRFEVVVARTHARTHDAHTHTNTHTQQTETETQRHRDKKRDSARALGGGLRG